MSTEKIENRPDHIKFAGRILFLTKDTSIIRRQLEASGEEAKRIEDELAEAFASDDLALMSNISTDEITPGWVCFYYDERLGQYVYVGMRDGAVKKDEVKQGGFAVVVSGLSKGCGSSRETAPYAEKWAGIQLVIAESIEKIYGQNSQNIGLLTSTDFGLIDRIRRGEEIALDLCVPRWPRRRVFLRCAGQERCRRDRHARQLQRASLDPRGGVPPRLCPALRLLPAAEALAARSGDDRSADQDGADCRRRRRRQRGQ